ncbi:MAG: right-handed parallel beta-helix repeat-containing protein [Armatimonadetes bacterium]|nr:right-handed parallel beta-helix repeat-containing protein [Armatimonadota bacterium]
MILRALALASACLLAGISPTRARSYIVDGGSPLARDANPGTAARPFKTIQRAADVAMAGDVVLIRPGTYAESVTVKNAGSLTRPIVFQATAWHGVTLVSPDDHTYSLCRSAQDSAGHVSAFFVTVRGLVFGHTPFRGWSGNNDFPMSVSCAHGWRFEDCVVQDNMGMGFGNGGGNDCDDVTLLRTIFQGCYTGGAGASGDGDAHPPRRLQNLRILDCLFRRNNPKNLDPGGYNGANKFLWHNNLLMDGVISYDNNGSGSWFDYGSTNFTVRNCTFFGNHAGYALDLSGHPLSTEETWAGGGFWSEANPGPALIENNVCYSNLGCGIGDLDSGSQGAFVIRNNWLVASGSNGLEFRGMDDGHARRLGPAQVTHNVFKADGTAWATSVEQNIPTQTPAGMGIVIDGNTYDPAPGVTGTWAVWKPSQAPQPISATGLSQIRSRLGAEAHGRVKATPFRGPLIHVFAYPTPQDAVNPDPAKLHQVPSAQAERLTIDRALGPARTGQVVTIPVFGHTPIVGVGRDAACQVYDLQARYVRLTLPNGEARKRLEAAVTPYAIIAPTSLHVRLTHREPYRIEAILLSP